MKKVTLITGGSRSGKSRYAQTIAMRYGGTRIFVATAEPVDEEMRARIRKHQAERAELFTTIEEPYDIGSAIASLPPGTDVAIVDCLTVWLGNLMYRNERCDVTAPPIQRLLGILDDPPCDVILVTNEVGMGIVPDSEMARRYRDLAGHLNQAVAQKADRVAFMVSGIPVMIKGEKD
ncbi:MAG: bifunctional adenosylcobinamide kinase/adenosylcobinamide-phosphate guanylyltransferase [Acidobacteriota bacterium]